MAKGKQVNGIDNVDVTAEMEKMRATVVHQELSARSFRATRQKMEDTIVIASIQEEYDIVMAENQRRMQEAQEAYYKAMQEAQASQQHEVSEQQTAPVVNLNSQASETAAGVTK